MRGICFIGAGKMATAIAGGMVRKNIKTEIHTFDPLPAADRSAELGALAAKQ